MDESGSELCSAVDFNISGIELSAASSVWCHVCYVVGICWVELTEKCMWYHVIHTLGSWIRILIGDLFFRCFFMQIDTEIS
jgi:hypothetical protein